MKTSRVARQFGYSVRVEDKTLLKYLYLDGYPVRDLLIRAWGFSA